MNTFNEEIRYEPQIVKFDKNGYNVNVVQELISLFKKSKVVKPPSQDVDEMLDWLES